jgi:hypothetical protein
MKRNSKRNSVTRPTLISEKTPSLAAVAFLAGLFFSLQAQDMPFVQQLTVSGLNELRFADGYDISRDVPRPWKYLTNSTDVRVGLRGLYLKTRFDVEEPSLGYNPTEPVYREYFSRRTLGFEMDPFFIEAGHVTTQFGRGLTLSLKEDRETEQYSLLDGVFGQLRYSWLTLQAVAGRPVDTLSRPAALLGVSGGRDPDTVLALVGADMRMRDLVVGAYTEAFFPVEKAIFSFLSSGSVGGGLVRYDAEVGPLTHDMVKPERTFWYQNRKSFYLPSIALNMARGGFGLSIDNAWMTGKIHEHYISTDSVLSTFDSAYTTPVGSSTYISANALFLGVSLLAEYKNYFYDRVKYKNNLVDGRTVTFSKEVSALLVPPNSRYQYSWHLLNKHLLSNLMDDALGYNFLITASPRKSTVVTANFSFGGDHDSVKSLRIKPKSDYWDAYAEWVEDAGERFNIKVGFDYGKLDPAYQNVTFRTLACDIEAGPFGKGHAFGLVLESQLNDKLFLAEKDSAALRNLIIRKVPSDSLVNPDTFGLDYLVPDDERTHYRQYAFNLLATLSYYFSPWLSLSLTLEREQVLESPENIHVVTDIESTKVNNYASIGVNLKPSPKHTILLEYGSMSGGRKCTLGTCVDLPMFKGFKLTITSML